MATFLGFLFVGSIILFHQDLSLLFHLQVAIALEAVLTFLVIASSKMAATSLVAPYLAKKTVAVYLMTMMAATCLKTIKFQEVVEAKMVVSLLEATLM